MGTIVGNTYTTLELEENSLQYGFDDDIFVMFEGGDSDFKVGNIYRFKFDSSFAKFADITIGDGYYPALVSYDDADWLYLGKAIQARDVYDHDECNKNCTYFIVSERDGDFPLGTRERYLGDRLFTCGDGKKPTYMYVTTKVVKLVDNREVKSEQVTLPTSQLEVGEIYEDDELEELYDRIPDGATFQYIEGDGDFVKGATYKLGSLSMGGSVTYIGELSQECQKLDDFSSGRVAWNYARFKYLGVDVSQTENIVDDVPTVGKVVSNYSNEPMVLYYGDMSQYHYDLEEGSLYDENSEPVEVTADVLNTVVESIQMYKKIDSRRAIMTLLDRNNGYVFRHVKGIGYCQHSAHTQMTASLSDLLLMDFFVLEDVEISEVI